MNQCNIYYIVTIVYLFNLRVHLCRTGDIKQFSSFLDNLPYKIIDILTPVKSQILDSQKDLIIGSSLIKKTSFKLATFQQAEYFSNQESSIILWSKLEENATKSLINNGKIGLKKACWIYDFPKDEITFPLSNIGQEIYYVQRPMNTSGHFIITESYQINNKK